MTTFQNFLHSYRNPVVDSKTHVETLRKSEAEPLTLSIYGHDFFVPYVVSGRRVASFSFADLCTQAYGAADYLELSKAFEVLFVGGIPKLSLLNRNEVRVFVDWLCMMICSCLNRLHMCTQCCVCGLYDPDRNFNG
jgi:predicted ATPase